MRFGMRRLLGVSALYLLFGLGLPACSGQQQEEEGMEVTEQGEQAAENGEGAGNEEGGDQAAGENQANEEVAGDTGNDMGNETAEGGNGTENDLQEIIQEMNGQQTAEAPPAENPMATPPAEAAPPAPVNMAAETPAAPAPAPAPAAAAAPAIPFQPGGTPAGTGLPEIGSKMAYVVEKGDTLGKISQKIYGSPGRWNELATLSGISNPSRIYPGDLVYYTLDEGAVKFAQAYEAIQRSEEQVKPGDTLATIAKRVYGTSTAWRAIWRQNDKIDNPDIVPPGTTVFYIPMGAASVAAKVVKNDQHKIAKVEKTNKKKSLNKTLATDKVTTKKQRAQTVSLNNADLGQNNVSAEQTAIAYHGVNLI